MKSESYGIYMPVLFGQGKRLGIAELKTASDKLSFF